MLVKKVLSAFLWLTILAGVTAYAMDEGRLTVLPIRVTITNNEGFTIYNAHVYKKSGKKVVLKFTFYKGKHDTWLAVNAPSDHFMQDDDILPYIKKEIQINIHTYSLDDSYGQDFKLKIDDIDDEENKKQCESIGILNKIVKHDSKTEEAKEDDSVCPVCYLPMGLDIRKLERCNHQLCQPCWNEWSNRSGPTNTCPLCRSSSENYYSSNF